MITHHELLNTNFPILSIIIVASINLIAPFIIKENHRLRNLLLVLISGIFLFNTLIVDYLFIYGVRVNWVLFSINYYEFALHLEPLGIVFLNLLSLLWCCSLLYATKYLLINQIEHSTRFLFFFNLTVIIGTLVSLAANLFTMFVLYELLTLATIPLIIHVSNKQTQEGLLKYLLILMSSSLLFFLPAIVIIYFTTHNGAFVEHGFIETHFSNSGAICLFVMFVFGISKAATFPLHGWLPAAMVATYPVSALLHAVVVVKAGLFCIFKVIIYVFGISYLHSIFNGFNWIILLPIITIFYSGYKALQTHNIKMILAYSTISNLSMSLLSVFMFTQKAFLAAVLHMLAHSIAKIGLFFACGNYYSLYHTYNVKDLCNMKSRMPKTSFLILIFTLSLIGLPPFAGFISKFYIMKAAAEEEQIAIMLVIAISSIISAFYMTPILSSIYRSADKVQENEEYKLPFVSLLTIGFCAAIASGFYFIYQLVTLFFRLYLKM